MAVSDPTTNYTWDLPTVDGSDGAWGDTLTAILGGDGNDGDPLGLDAVIDAVSTVADAAMPKSGGTFTGEVKFLTSVYTVSALGNISTSQELDLDAANVFTATVTDDVTINFSNDGITGAVFVTLILTNGAAGTITWDEDIDWPGGSSPNAELQSSGVDIITFLSVDGGTTWHGQLASSNSS